MIKMNMKNRNINKINKKDLAVPDWAKWEEKPTIHEKVKGLVKQLPIHFRFHSKVIHAKLIKDSNFSTTAERRTREALLELQNEGIIKHLPNVVTHNGAKVKLYEVIKR